MLLGENSEAVRVLAGMEKVEVEEKVLGFAEEAMADVEMALG